MKNAVISCLFTHVQSLRQAPTQTGSLQEEERPTVVPLFTFSALIRLWTQNAILQGARRKSLKILPISQVRPCVFT